MKNIVFALIAGVAAAGAAQAQTATPYIGAGVASVDHNYSSGLLGATGSGTGSGWKSSGKIFGGVDFDQTWGAEAGYTDFRKSSFDYSVGGEPGHVESDGHSFYLAGKATAPVNDQFAVYGKLGVAQNKRSLTGSLARSDSETEAYGAVGASYNLSKQVALSLEYERYGKKKDYGAKPDVWTVAAKYSF